MPLARDLHPEFGYIGNAPAVLRKLGFAIAFVGVGSIAAISNLSTIVSPPDDPMQAMALAPEQTVDSAAPSPANSPASAPSATSAEERPAPSRFCGGAITVNCIPMKMHRPHPAPAANERPAIAAVAIGHREETPVLAVQPAPVSPVEPSNPAISATPAETLAAPVDPGAAESPAAAETPTAPAPAHAPVPVPMRKSRPRNNYVQHRDHERSSYRPSYSYHSTQNGYARVW